IARIKRFTTWALADWLNYGEKRYGETYAQAVDATGLQSDYLAIIKSVGAAVDASRRRESLSFTHHRLVASLEPQEQERFLAEAEKNGWSNEQLREAVRDFKGQIEDWPEQPDDESESAYSQSEARRELGSLRAQRIATALEWISQWERESKELGW